MYAEHAPPAALAGVVECFWTNGAGPDDGHRVMPDGAIDVVITYHGHDVVSATVVGTMTTAIVVPSGTTRYAGVRFLPGAAPSLLGVDASELTDRQVPLDDVWRGGVDPRDLTALVMRRAAGTPVDSRLGAPPDIAAAVALIRRSRGRLAVSELGPSLGMSRQQLARRFTQAVGVTPKTFARVVRFQALLRRARTTPDWTALAYGLGYADQAHLVNDFRALAGLTPTAWFQNSKTEAPAAVSMGA